MAKETESNNKSLTEDNPVDLVSCKVDAVASRRRFTRQAIMGGAVLFSLGNRPAWGQDLPVGCISVATWASVAAGFESHHPPGYATYEPIVGDTSDLPIGYCPPN